MFDLNSVPKKESLLLTHEQLAEVEAALLFHAEGLQKSKQTMLEDPNVKDIDTFMELMADTDASIERVNEAMEQIHYVKQRRTA